MAPEAADARDAVVRAFRSEYGRTLAVIVRLTGDVQVAEDAVSEAFAAASTSWLTAGVPPNPQAWIVTVAKRRAIDALRRAQTARGHPPAASADDVAAPPSTGWLDDELRLMLLCAHPALSSEAQVTLMLRLVGGLSVDEIARLFGARSASIAQRISRAKEKIRANGMARDEPDPATLTARLSTLMSVIYGIFNEGYVATTGSLLRDDLADEGVRLARALFRVAKDEPEVRGLLALLLLLAARRAARVDDDGALVVLADQDRARWNKQRIAEGQALLRGCLDLGQPGAYQLQAAIQAVHCDAAVDVDTDWHQLRVLYDHLYTLQPTAAVATSRALAVERTAGAKAALESLKGVEHGHYTEAVRAHIMARSGDPVEAAAAYRRAAQSATNDTERAHLERLAAMLVPDDKEDDADRELTP